MSTRNKIAILLGVCVLAIAATVGALLRNQSDNRRAKQHSTPVAQTSFAELATAPRIVFRSTSRASNYGAVAAVALSDPSGPRGYLEAGTAPVQCDRVYATAANLLCLASDRGIVTTYSADIYRTADGSASKEQNLPLAGVPSRARLSADGKLAATTSFVQGDSYAATTFSTRTVVSRVGGASYGSLEDFRLIHQGKAIKPADRNYWGVTFAADDNTFYATVEWGQHTWLVRGSLAERTVRTLVEDAECPSLAPDGRNIVYKQRGDRPKGQWRLVDYDVATGRVTPLAEQHSVDDQVEWLDDQHVLYGLPRSGTDAAESDVWSVPIDGSGSPKLVIPEAWSPAVIR